MLDADINAQILADADEIEFTFGSQYPAGSPARMAFQYCANLIRREFSLSDVAKMDITLKILQHVGPCTKSELVERTDFTRDESRRIIDLAIQSGMIETTQETTSGRSRVLLQIP